MTVRDIKRQQLRREILDLKAEVALHNPPVSLIRHLAVLEARYRNCALKPNERKVLEKEMDYASRAPVCGPSGQVPTLTAEWCEDLIVRCVRRSAALIWRLEDWCTTGMRRFRLKKE